MNLKDCQILDINSVNQSELSLADELNQSSRLLEWITDNPFFKSEIFESTMDVSGQTFYRFSITATDDDKNQYHGFGRSKIRLKAASTAAGEVIERYIAKKILKASKPFFASHIVNVADAEISMSKSNSDIHLPSIGLHSSNGWAVHFSLKAALENSVIEALERHTLLYSFLQSGWDGFYQDQQIPFKSEKLTPYVSRYSFGGFGAGIVATEGEKFKGRTFGYLCDDSEKLNGSEKWLNAFFESHAQWEILSEERPVKENVNHLIKYQSHYLQTPNDHKSKNTFLDQKNVSSNINANILMLDLKKALDLPIPIFAAFCFGRDLIPLFFKQKLSNEEISQLKQTFKKWDLPLELPEYHPVL